MPFWFQVQASSHAPVACQWFFNQTTPLNGDTNYLFQAGPARASDAGLYSVVLSNAAGVVTSTPVALQVIAPVERRWVPALHLFGDAGNVLNLDYANSIAPAPDWMPLGVVSLVSTSQMYFDLTAPQAPQRYYRAWRTGTPGLVPSLNLPGMAPAITLAGSIGDHLRLDYINQVGPTNAWVTLATVTLTNTSQLYFDTSSIGRPPRLWRITPVP